jgi:membrane-associated phospholipid phosphatase
LLAFILSFSLRFSRSRTARKIFLIPVIWAVLVAISRVALGAHTAWDVIFGAATGTLTGFMLMHYDLLRRALLHRDHKLA